ncbi:MAG: ferric reductase-like transmembrane domain-containing protein [Bdellovibrionia bacterium]
MNKIKTAWWLSLVFLSAAWIFAEPSLFNTTEIIPMRNLIVQYSGILAMGWMSLAMILAARPKFSETWFGGLDKMYRLHKWLGISVAVLSFSHWLTVKAPKWAVALGILERTKRGPRPEAATLIENWISSQRGLAEVIGEWTFFGALILIAIALTKKISYRTFYKSHLLFSVIYLGLVFHTVVLTKYSYWTTPLGLVMLPLLLCGAIAAVLSLFRKIGIQHQSIGKIERVEYFPGVKTLEICIQDLKGWHGHRPGQFAFVTTSQAKEAHPFTIASAWHEKDAKITFVVKELGDYTKTLRESLQVEQEVKIEGPYGCFTFDDTRPTQIWIGGGIGIAPFIARMKFLAENKNSKNQTIYLFHPTAQADDHALEKLNADAKAAGVHLHVFVDTQEQHLSGETIRKVVPEWQNSSFWFCGPVGLAEALKTDFSKAGQPIDKLFHQELFEMR